MRTTATQDKNFISEVISSDLLESAIEYIKNNFEAEEIYGKVVLENWAEDNGYAKEE